MSLLTWIKGVFQKMNLPSEVKTDFGVKEITAQELNRLIDFCARVYKGEPDWLDIEGHVKTINFARSVCSETARLATMNIGVEVSGSARAKWLQEQVDKTLDELRRWIEYGNAYGTVILKPNGETVDIITPDRMVVTEASGGQIRGVVFLDQRYENEEDRWYTRLEYHRFVKGVYTITNRCYWGATKTSLTHKIDIKDTPWNGLTEEVRAEGVDDMLFGVYKTPAANNVDMDSPLGLPLFADAIAELEDLDVAYSRNAKEIFDSKRTVIIDSDRLLQSGGRIGQQNKDALIAQAGLPDYVRAVEGTGQGDIYHEINPTLNTTVRLEGLNALLSQIGYKCGFSNGYFVFNQKSGMVTATQVESDDRRTLQLINDIRHDIEIALDGLLYALDKFADAYSLAPRGTYEVTYDFADLTLNQAEDQARWYNYVAAGRVPFWYYLTKYEGFSEEEAKELAGMATQEAVQNMALMGGMAAE